MNPNSHLPSLPSANSCPLAPVTREVILTRTRELALRAGRVPPQVDQVDYEEAKRELTDETELDRQCSVQNTATSAVPPVATGVRLLSFGTTTGTTPALLQLME
ncbi:MAG: hypothetical protein HZC55_13115 [Verrucomicrobia bacterium]|nr:hypothetical protein [Verrucomicrobiota bacterium]